MLSTVHQGLGYAVVLLVLTTAVLGVIQAREQRPFGARLYVVATLAVDLQVLGGLIVYGLGGYLTHPSLLIRIVHPVLAVLALVPAHVSLRRARRRREVAGHRIAAAGLALSLLAMLLAIAAATAGLDADLDVAARHLTSREATTGGASR